MARYRVVLELETGEHGAPAEWDWARLIATPDTTGVHLVEVEELDD
jgi:hypothetical protein